MTKTVIAARREQIMAAKCDKCGKIADAEHSAADLMELQEFLHYRETLGYGAESGALPYGDGDVVECDLCQDCKFELLGPYMRKVTNVINGPDDLLHI